MGRSYQKDQLNVAVKVKWLKHQRARLFSECRWILNTLGKANLSGVRILGYSLIYKIHRKIKAFIGALNFVRAGPATEHNVVYIIPCVIACRVGIWFLSCPSMGYINSHSILQMRHLQHFIDEGRGWATRGSKAHWLQVLPMNIISSQKSQSNSDLHSCLPRDADVDWLYTEHSDQGELCCKPDEEDTQEMQWW